MKGNISLKVVQPCIAIRGTLASPVDAFLCVEKTVLSKLTRLEDSKTLDLHSKFLCI